LESSLAAQLYPAQELTKEEVTYTVGNFKIFPENEDWQIIHGVVILKNYEPITTTFKSWHIMPFCAHSSGRNEHAHLLQPQAR
jgi:hypothetical protein